MQVCSGLLAQGIGSGAPFVRNFRRHPQYIKVLLNIADSTTDAFFAVHGTQADDFYASAFD